MNETQILEIPSYTLQETSHDNVKRYVDLNGDWNFYYLEKTKEFVPAVSYVLSLGYAKGQRFAEYLLNSTREEAQKKLKVAGEQGTRTHQAIADLLAGLEVTMDTLYMDELVGKQTPLNADEWKNLRTFVSFCEKYKPALVAYEYTVFSKKIKYAGTADALVVLTVPEKDTAFPKEMWGQKVLALLDWKTSSGIWNEYKAQTASYYKATREMRLFTKFFNSYKGRFFTGVVRLGTRHKCGFEIKAWDEKETEKNFEKFLSAYEIAKDEIGKAPDTEQIPTTLSWKFPQAKTLPKPKKK